MNHYIDVVTGKGNDTEVIRRINITDIDCHDDIRNAIFDHLDKKYGKENVNSFQTSIELDNVDKELEQNFDYSIYKISSNESILTPAEEIYLKKELTREKLTKNFTSYDLPDLIAKLNGFKTDAEFKTWRFSKADANPFGEEKLKSK